ncbi:MAG: TniQ family protein [Limnobacter sp.]|uniref:TniQ family protein n=1 Tax=Limnobacter sp. TaxID=2003368 RepID=UPI0040382EF8
MSNYADHDLPCVPNVLAPQSGEGLESYLLRVADHNGLLGIRELLRPIPGYTMNKSVFAYLDQVAIITAQNAKDLANLRRIDQGYNTLIQDRHYRMLTTPVCPMCLKEHGYAKQIWQHTLCTACPEHSVRLVDSCDHCGSAIAKDRYHLTACNCGRDLTLLNTVKVSNAERWINMRLAIDVTPCPPMRDFGNTDPVQWINFVTLLEFLYTHSSHNKNISTGKTFKPKSIQQSVSIINDLIPLFEDFPNRLSDLVKFRLELAPPDSLSAEHRLGYWIKKLTYICGFGRYSEFIRAVRDAVTEHSDGKYHINDKVATTENSRYMSVSQLANQLRIHEQTVLRMIERKVLRFVEIPHELKTRSLLIEKSSAAELDEFLQNFITKADAMRVTGLSRKSIEYFIEYGIFESLEAASVGLNSNRAISAISIEAFTSKLASQVKNEEGPKVKLKNFGARMTTNTTIHRALYTSLQDGTLMPASSTANKKLADFEFLEADIRKILQAGEEETLLKISDVANILKIKEEVIRSWVKQGFMRSVESLLRGQKVNLIPVSALAEFQQTYIVLSTLADRLGTSSRMILKAIESQGLKTIGSFEVSDGVSRGYLIEATELGKLLLGQQAKAA